MKRIALAAILLLSVVSAHAAAVGSRGGKKAITRRIDASGYPIGFSDDIPWKVFESTQVGAYQVVDESGVAPKVGMVGLICISTTATTEYMVIYDTTVVATGLTSAAAGVRMAPPFMGSSTAAKCLTLNAEFTSGLAVYESTSAAYGGVYVYWRELGSYR